MATGAASGELDSAALRSEFPILSETIRGKPLSYLDNAATTQKPEAVLRAMDGYYRTCNANIHRGVHLLSERATDQYERARSRVRSFINAAGDHEIVFVRGTTEAINLVAATFGRVRLKPGDEVLVSHMEHHSNIVPWQMVCGLTGAKLRVIPIDDAGQLVMEEFDRLLNERTRIVSVVHVSNALGTVNPVGQIIAKAHAVGARVLLDGAQAVAHMPVDVEALNCDFYAFSGHKLYGPTGIGVLYGKAELLDAMPPYQGGGDMISSVTFEGTTYNTLPAKFEAGTPHIEGAIGLGAAIEYVQRLGLDRIERAEARLLAYATDALQSVPGVRLIGTAARKAGILSFVMDGVHPHDIGTIVDQEGVAIRTGHHCCQPVMARYGVPATARASLALYNDRSDIDALVRALHRVREVLL